MGSEAAEVARRLPHTLPAVQQQELSLQSAVTLLARLVANERKLQPALTAGAPQPYIKSIKPCNGDSAALKWAVVHDIVGMPVLNVV